jgi:hypothetical protein
VVTEQHTHSQHLQSAIRAWIHYTTCLALTDANPSSLCVPGVCAAVTPRRRGVVGSLSWNRPLKFERSLTVCRLVCTVQYTVPGDPGPACKIFHPPIRPSIHTFVSWGSFSWHPLGGEMRAGRVSAQDSSMMLSHFTRPENFAAMTIPQVA